jgi:flagellar assembly protein FliH
MSSRLIRPEDPCPGAVPMAWRQVEIPGRTPSYIPPPPAAPAAAAPPARSSPAAAGPPSAPNPREMDTHEIENRIREARAAGVKEGEAAGKAKAAAEMQPVMERLARSIEEIAKFRPRLRREAEQDLIRLSLAIARRIIRRELAIDPEALHGLILGALEKLQGQEICRVRVHPSHAAAVTACLKQIASGSPVEVIPDASREVGTVIFETDRGNLDASVESQLREIERGLGDRLRNAK